MPRVYLGKEVYEVDEELYKEFLYSILVMGLPLDNALAMYDNGDRMRLGDYITYRLAEVDPGYTP